MSSWHSPQSIYSLGHNAVRDLFSVEVQVQEKVDGSFFAFGWYPVMEPDGGLLKEVPNVYELKVRSKGAVMVPEAPPAMFKPAVDTVKSIQHLLKPGWQYRGETLCKPKHNALNYNRVPKGNVILFDVLTDDEQYLSYEDLKAEAQRLGLEVVPQLFSGTVNSALELRKFLDLESVLGGQKIEGVVIKPLKPLYGPDKKMLFGKFVSEAFKEVHRKAWGESNPGPTDIILKLGTELCTPARWQKAVLRMKEAGTLTNSPKDIGPLMGSVVPDIKKEEEEYIKEKLFKYAWPHIARMATRGLPEWYKEQLLNLQFEKEAEDAREI
jgi:hypothetical protein